MPFADTRLNALGFSEIHPDEILAGDLACVYMRVGWPCPAGWSYARTVTWNGEEFDVFFRPWASGYQWPEDWIFQFVVRPTAGYWRDPEELRRQVESVGSTTIRVTDS